MRQVTDTCSYIVMSPEIQYQRQSLQAFDKSPVPFYGILWYPCGRCDNIVGIFNQDALGIGVTGFFRARHGMSADKICFHVKFRHPGMDVRLGAAHIRDDAGRADQRLQLL